MRAHLLSFFFGAVVFAAIAACGPTNKCSTATCSGCCDASGQCQPGNLPTACGVSGGTCTPCATGQSCSFGVCGGAGIGGGNATGGGGGSTGGGGGSTGGGGGGGGSITVERICTEIIDAQMAYLVRCGAYSAAGAADLGTQSKQNCISRGLPGLKDGRVMINATNYSACLAALPSLACTSSPETLPSCMGLVVGTVPLSGSCYEDQDCQTGLYCNSGTSCPGTCALRIAVGQTVVSGQKCVVTAENYNGTCLELVAVGQSCAPVGGSTAKRACVAGATCNAADQCATLTRQTNGMSCNDVELRCALGLQCVSGTCIPLVTAGNACDSVRSCQEDLRCSSANVCTAPGAVGATCSNTGDCKYDLFCNKPVGMSTGTCAARRSAGQTCTYVGYECAADLYCDATASSMTGACRQPIAAGGTCSYTGPYNQCAGGTYCTATSSMMSGVCANEKGTGASCASSRECQSSNCAMGTCAAPTYCYDPTP